MSIKTKLKSTVISIAMTSFLGASLIGLEASSAPSAIYQKIENDPSKSGVIVFDRFMIEVYDPITDEPTGEYALFQAPNNQFSLDMLPGFKDVRISPETIDALGNVSSVSLVSIIANGQASNLQIPVCVAAEIGATLTNDVAGTSFPAYSESQHQFCIPSLAFPKVAILPNGTAINLPADCYQVTLDTATTQKNGVLKMRNNVAIDKSLCQ